MLTILIAVIIINVEMANSSDLQVNLALCFIAPEYFENFKMSVMEFH